VNTLEDRLRDAYRAAAETVRPEAIGQDAILSPPDHTRRRARRTGRPGRGPSRLRVLIPVAAAVAVIAVAAAVAVLVPRAAPGLGRGNPTTSQTAPPTLLTTPAYFVAMNWTQHPSMYVVNATTGVQGARISLPFPRTDLTSVATGDGQTFVAAATAPTGCSTTLYRFTLAANGTPSAMTAFTTIAGQIGDPWNMAVSAGSRFIAYETLACGQQINSVAAQNNAKGYLSVLDTVTGRTKRWTFRNDLQGTGNVSISADGSVVGFANEVIDTAAPSGRLAAHARVVATNGEFGAATDVGGLNVSPDGKTVYFETNKVVNDKPVWTSWQLRSFDIATGQTSLVRNIQGTEGSPAAVTFDPTGSYMLIEDVTEAGPTTNLIRLDLATGQGSLLNVSWAVNPAFAW
jgi:hypothetical protein